MMSEQLIYKICQSVFGMLGHMMWLGAAVALFYYLWIRNSSRLRAAERTSIGLVLLGAIPLLAIGFTVGGIPKIPIGDGITIPVSKAVIYLVSGLWVSGVVLGTGFLLANAVKYWGIKKRAVEAGALVLEVRRKLGDVVTPPVKTTRELDGPVLCGFRNPLILIPEKILKKSDRKCIEAIIAHETAHHQRRDIPLNLGQVLVEIANFFNPGARWLAQQIRDEREKACDDRAVEMMAGRSMTYASSLLKLESVATRSGLALAFGSESSSDRAARIAFGEKREKLPCSSLIAGLTFTIVMLIFGSVISIVKVSAVSMEVPQGTRVNTESVIRSAPVSDTVVIRVLNNEEEWRDKQIGKRKVPMLKAVTLIERDGVVYDLIKEKPRLFPEVPNAWLLDHPLNLLKRNLMATDPDGDRFTVLEEYHHGTDPANSSSYPDACHLLSFVGQHHEMYRIKYAAKTDSSTIQLIRMPTSKYPNHLSFFLKEGEVSPDQKIRLRAIDATSIQIEEIETGSVRVVEKQVHAEFKTYYAELAIRGGDNFIVKEKSDFYIPDFPVEKWHLAEVSDSGCLIRPTADPEGKSLELKKKSLR